MTDKFEIKDKIWNGAINVKIKFNDGTSEFKEYLLVIPRVSYLPIYYKTITSYFNNFCEVSEPIYLQYRSIPIKWNLPVGVIYDMYHLPIQASDTVLDKSTTLELELKHGGSWPDEIIPVTYKGAVNYEQCLTHNYFNQLKQSNYVISGNSKLVMNLSKDNSTKIWQAIKDHDLNDYSSINKKLIPKTINKVPIKILVAKTYTVQLPAETNLNLDLLLQNHSSAQAFIHGINVKSLGGVSVEEIWSIFRHSDNFLYIIVI